MAMPNGKGGLLNPNPTVYEVAEIHRRVEKDSTDEDEHEPFDALEVFGMSSLLLNTLNMMLIGGAFTQH